MCDLTRRPQKPAVAARRAREVVRQAPRLRTTTTTCSLHITPPPQINPNRYSAKTPTGLPDLTPQALHTPQTHNTKDTMDQAKEFLEMPREFVKDGRQFITRCSKRMSPLALAKQKGLSLWRNAVASATASIGRRACRFPLHLMYQKC